MFLQFLKSEADLEYIEKRLKLDFINSTAENGCPAEVATEPHTHFHTAKDRSNLTPSAVYMTFSSYCRSDAICYITVQYFIFIVKSLPVCLSVLKVPIMKAQIIVCVTGLLKSSCKDSRKQPLSNTSDSLSPTCFKSFITNSVFSTLHVIEII